MIARVVRARPMLLSLAPRQLSPQTSRFYASASALVDWRHFPQEPKQRLYPSAFASNNLPLIFKSPQVRMYSTERKQDEEEQNKQEKPRTGLARGVAAASAVGAFALGKTKTVLGLLKFAKFGPLISMFASVGAYSIFFGLPFGIGMVGLLFIHEAGHLAVLKYYKIPAGMGAFIPFIGASVQMQGRPKDVKEEAIVALGGPIVGGAAAVACSVVGVALNSQLLIALANFGLMLNLLNLLPINPLDGGRIAGALSPYFLLSGMFGGAYLIYAGMIQNPLFFLIMLTGAFSTWDRFMGEGSHESYYKIPNSEKAGIFAAYIALIIGLMFGLMFNQSNLKSLKQIREELPPDQRHESEWGKSIEKFADEWSEEAELSEEEALLRQREQEFMDRHFAPSSTDFQDHQSLDHPTQR